MKLLTKFRTLSKHLANDTRGVAATEFAIIGPIFILILAGGTDVGLASFKKMQINEAVSSAAAAALYTGSAVTSASVDASAQSLATILTSAVGQQGSENSFLLSYNGGRTYSFVGSQGKAVGAASAADECRCPTQANGTISWGGKVECSTKCPNGSLAGKYVAIQYTRSYTPLFAQYGFIKDDGITVQTLAQVQ